MAYIPKSFTRNVVKIHKPSVIVPDDPLRKEFIKFINTLRCPICKSNLDGSVGEITNIYCRLDPDEYNAQYQQGTKTLLMDSIKCNDWKNDWKIDHQRLENNKYKTTVWILIEAGFSLPQHKFVMEHEGEILFSASDFNEESFFKKMELYDVFS